MFRLSTRETVDANASRSRTNVESQSGATLVVIRCLTAIVSRVVGIGWVQAKVSLHGANTIDVSGSTSERAHLTGAEWAVGRKLALVITVVAIGTLSVGSAWLASAIASDERSILFTVNEMGFYGALRTFEHAGRKLGIGQTAIAIQGQALEFDAAFVSRMFGEKTFRSDVRSFTGASGEEASENEKDCEYGFHDLMKKDF